MARLLATFGSCLLLLLATVCLVTEACDDTHGMHCLTGKWECPITVFDKVGRGIKESFCAHKCCLCIKSAGAARCTPDDLLPNQEIFINPNFVDYPVKHQCAWCPKGTEKKAYTHKCFDQRTVGFPKPENECANRTPVAGFVLPNGVGNFEPFVINV